MLCYVMLQTRVLAHCNVTIVVAPWTFSSWKVRRDYNTSYLLVIVLPTTCVSPPGKQLIPLSLSTSLNSFLTRPIFRPDRCVLIQISLPDHPILLATFPLGPFLCLCILLGTLYLHTFVLETLSIFKRHLKFHLFQSAFTV